MFLEKLKCKLQYVLPHHFLSRLIAKLADCRITWVKNNLIKAFIHHYQVDVTTAAITKLSEYPSFNAFFTRQLNPLERPIAQGKKILSCPADGSVSKEGLIQHEQIFQAKGHDFNLTELLGADPNHAKKYQNGQFITIYLAPKDYHRVHMPTEGRLLETIYIPGKLFSVNRQTAAQVPNLFCQNERLVCLFDTPAGEMALIMVGAMLVAGIKTVWGQQETPCQGRKMLTKDYTDKNICLAKGAEMGLFQFGSTVILLFAPNQVKLVSFKEQETVKMGQFLGEIILDRQDEWQ